MARTMKRVYEMLKNYKLEDLVRDAKAGLYRAMPELAETDAEVRALISNGRAMEQGEGAFFSKVTFHDGYTTSRMPRDERLSTRIRRRSGLLFFRTR
jgi:hypothetical protein